MKTIKAKYYLLPIIICLVVIGGLVYYYFLTEVAKEDKISYLYIDDDDTADSVYVKLEPIANAHGYVPDVMPSNLVRVLLRLYAI